MNFESAVNLKESYTKRIHERLVPKLDLRDHPTVAFALKDPRLLEADGPRNFLAKPSIAFGITKNVRGDFRLAVLIQDRRLKNAYELDEIRKRTRGEVDIRYIGRVKARVSPIWCQGRHRPLRPGASIAHHLNTAGTLTCFVKDRGVNDWPLYALSNSHVLCHRNSVSKDASTIQPGPADKGKHPKDRIGELYKSVYLSETQVNRVDRAISRLDDGIDCEKTYLAPKKSLTGVRRNVEDLIQVDQAISKIGRTTGLTSGSIHSTEVELTVNFNNIGVFEFDGVIRVEGSQSKVFSQGGDSGSLVVDRDGAAIGMVFAGDSSGKRASYVIPIQATLDRLNVDLAL